MPSGSRLRPIRKRCKCHRTDCQTATGTAFRVSIPVHGASLKVTGEPAIYVKTTAESGKPRVQAFCGKCGSPIYSTTLGGGVQPSYTLRVGILRQRDQLAAAAANLVALGAPVGDGTRSHAKA